MHAWIYKASRYFTLYYTPKTLSANALHQDWNELGNSNGRLPLWIIPPFQLIGPTIKKLLSFRLNAIMLLPAWACYWTAVLDTLLITAKLVLSYHRGMYTIGSRVPDNMQRSGLRYSLIAYKVHSSWAEMLKNASIMQCNLHFKSKYFHSTAFTYSAWRDPNIFERLQVFWFELHSLLLQLFCPNYSYHAACCPCGYHAQSVLCIRLRLWSACAPCWQLLQTWRVALKSPLYPYFGVLLHSLSQASLQSQKLATI